MTISLGLLRLYTGLFAAFGTLAFTCKMEFSLQNLWTILPVRMTSLPGMGAADQPGRGMGECDITQIAAGFFWAGFRVSIGCRLSRFGIGLTPPQAQVRAFRLRC